MDHPKIPNYEIMNIPRDPGTSWSYNLGVGIARDDGQPGRHVFEQLEGRHVSRLIAVAGAHDLSLIRGQQDIARPAIRFDFDLPQVENPIAVEAKACNSSASNSRPAGLCGLLKMMARVLGPTAASSASFSNRHSGG